MPSKQIVLKRGYVYQVLLRFEATHNKQLKKIAVCLQSDELCSAWSHANFARTHSFKDNKEPMIFPWDVWVPPAESRSEFGIKIVCNEIWSVEKEFILDEIYKLPADKIKEMDRKLIIGLGL